VKICSIRVISVPVLFADNKKYTNIKATKNFSLWPFCEI
jgi:hypothetical protein